jgi:hypothetical protein
MVKGERINYKEIACRNIPGYILKLIEIDSCICYERVINLIAVLKYAESQQFHEISSVEELSVLLSRREFVIYN